MSDLYAIKDVPDRLRDEGVGTREKFWYRQRGERDTHWLFKFPRPNSGEHWAEKVAAEIAGLIGISHARVELAVFRGQRGSATESFARGVRELWHGDQVLRFLRGYDPGPGFRQPRHTLQGIWRALDKVFGAPSVAATRARRSLADYVVFDALIGNTDRHHANWGILRKRPPGAAWQRVAPSFDHASSLGRELLDARRNMLLSEDRLGQYVERGRGGIYWAPTGDRACSPLELARRAAEEYPVVFRPALERLRALKKGAVDAVIRRVPEDWMTPAARRFAVALVRYTREELERSRR